MKSIQAAFLFAMAVGATACDRIFPSRQPAVLGSICVHRAMWNSLALSIHQFAAADGLEFRSGIDERPDREPFFKAEVVRHHSFWLAENSVLVISNRQSSSMDLLGFSQGAWTSRDTKIAIALKKAIEPSLCEAELTGS
ncbi:hypothetical protein EAH84_15350 [Sphingomonas oligophenolica]|uniref:Uncharacterized protein n=2 Tax=Sphingomonas oligophenolica TaxID=301154 RepID=A0A502BUQ6_9SPHN|nr:hypothetical protein EAH84_15350 [Sphingomonas oligophenolica]